MNYYIVEDQKDARDLIQKYIEEDYPQLQCIGTGDRYANALEAIPKLQPDLQKQRADFHWQQWRRQDFQRNPTRDC